MRHRKTSLAVRQKPGRLLLHVDAVVLDGEASYSYRWTWLGRALRFLFGWPEKAEVVVERAREFAIRTNKEQP